MSDIGLIFLCGIIIVLVLFIVVQKLVIDNQQKGMDEMVDVIKKVRNDKDIIAYFETLNNHRLRNNMWIEVVTELNEALEKKNTGIYDIDPIDEFVTKMTHDFTFIKINK